MYLLDTNTISELRKSRSGRADPNVAAWAGRTPGEEQHVSVITLHELELGVRLKERADPSQGRVLRHWLEGKVVPLFAPRTLDIDPPIARLAAGLHVPDPRPFRDAFIAATALVHGLTIVTRNTSDFAPMGVALLNPWD